MTSRSNNLEAHVRYIVESLSFSIGELTQMLERKNINDDDFHEDVTYTKEHYVKCIIRLIEQGDAPNDNNS